MGTWGDVSPGAPLATDLADISVVTARIDNLVDGLDGTDSLGAVDINGGAIDGTPIGVTTASQGFFTQFSATGSAVFNSNVTFSQNVTMACILVVNASATIKGIHSISGIVVSATAHITSALTTSGTATFQSALVGSATLAIGSTASFVGSINTPNVTVASYATIASGAAIGGPEYIKWTYISATGNIVPGSATVAHGQVNIRGVSNAYAIHGSQVTNVWCDSTNIHYTQATAVVGGINLFMIFYE